MVPFYIRGFSRQKPKIEPLPGGRGCDPLMVRPERTRTPDTRFRKPLLYPAELRARMLRTLVRVSIFYTIPPFDVHVNCWQEIRVRTPLLHPFLNS